MNSGGKPAPDAGGPGGGARRLARAVAGREQSRRRLNATTVTVSAVSVLAAGGVAAVLPGTSHAAPAATGNGSSSASPGSSSGSSSDSGTSGSTGTPGDRPASGVSSDQGGLHGPGSAPQAVTGGAGGGSTSGGT